MMLCKGRLKTGISGFQTASSFVKSQIDSTQDDGTGGLAGLFDGQD